MQVGFKFGRQFGIAIDFGPEITPGTVAIAIHSAGKAVATRIQRFADRAANRTLEKMTRRKARK